MKNSLVFLALALVAETSAQSQFGNLLLPTQSDVPDLSFTDSNGDGLDGMRIGPVYVSTSGNDRNVGTIDSPMRTINAGLLRASLLGGRAVYVVGTSFSECVFLPSGADLYGGYRTGTFARDNAFPANSVSTIGLGGVAEDITGCNLQLINFNAASGTGPAGSSVGFIIRAGTSFTRIFKCGFIANNATAGTAGTNGANGTAGLTGKNGGSGSVGFFGTGGAGGQSVNAGGAGGDGGFGTVSGKSGRVGEGTNGGAGGSGGSILGFADPGSNGGIGTNGTAGTISSSLFYGIGTTSNAGTRGSGGGGGGGGASTVTQGGGGGGGGGGAGEGAQPGTPGESGGNSIGIIWLNTNSSNSLWLEDCTVQAKTPGAGGKGGNGGNGGAGGAGGTGGTSFGAFSGRDGGDGGRGGHGGGGAGGNAGSSVSILYNTGFIFTPSTTPQFVSTAATRGAGGTSSGWPGPLGKAGLNSAIATTTETDPESMKMNVPEVLATSAFASMPSGSPKTVVPYRNAIPFPLSFTPSVLITTTIVPRNGTTSRTGSVLFYTPDAGFVGFDRFSYTVNGTVPGIAVVVVYQQLKGKVTLGDWPGQAPLTIPVDYLDINGTLIGSTTVSLDAAGNYTTFGPIAGGPIKMRFKTSHWLSAERTIFNFNGNLTGLNVTLRNGDVDGDDEVSILDYLSLSNAYDLSAGQSGFNVNADLDGDSLISILDYLILSSNYELSGPIG